MHPIEVIPTMEIPVVRCGHKTVDHPIVGDLTVWNNQIWVVLWVDDKGQKRDIGWYPVLTSIEIVFHYQQYLALET